MSTLNCTEEIELAERLLQIHPWAEMLQIWLSQVEACSIAIRIARSFTKKQLILFCGYHGMA